MKRARVRALSSAERMRTSFQRGHRLTDMVTTGPQPSADFFSGRTAQTGVLVAATIIPETFTPSLTSRSWIDQGVITGFATSLDYLLTVTAKDTLGGITAAVESALPRAMRERP
jgi:uncharacterized membrane protein